MKLLVKEHRNASRIIPAPMQKEVKEACNIKASSNATDARKIILDHLRDNHGWSDGVTLCAEAKISITSKKGETGLCLQTGNMSRFYADLLKLEFLFQEQLIHGAIYILPDRHLAKAWGQNIANFERFTNEVAIFAQIINTPLLIFGLTQPA